MFAQKIDGISAWAGAVAVVAAGLVAPAGAAGPHQRSQASLTSTERCDYRITQNNEDKGSETITRRVFNNNTVEFVIDASMLYGQGMTLKQHIEMSLEEESFFPRRVSIHKTMVQPDSTSFDHTIDVDMVSNVAVVSSKLNGKGDARRIVVPTGIPVSDIGVLGYIYEILFWYNREVGAPQRFQWLDPLSVSVNSGEIKLEKSDTIAVMGKKTPVSVFNLEREKVGQARVWVNKDGVIVRGEMNQFVYELTGRKKS